MFEAYRQPSDRLPQAIGFRAINDSDLPFLAALYATTRAEEMQMVDWPQSEKDQFLQMQFNAQHKHYQEHFASADFLVIEQQSGNQKDPIGRVYVDRRDDEIRLIDIALIPQCRNSGLGLKLLQDLLEEAANKELPVRIHVEQFNPAMRLYQRLGFQTLEDQGVYLFMEWRPEAQHTESDQAIQR